MKSDHLKSKFSRCWDANILGCRYCLLRLCLAIQTLLRRFVCLRQDCVQCASRGVSHPEGMQSCARMHAEKWHESSLSNTPKVSTTTDMQISDSDVCDLESDKRINQKQLLSTTLLSMSILRLDSCKQKGVSHSDVRAVCDNKAIACPNSSSVSWGVK
eukprot:1100374-Amphidinium_carterae.1